MASFQLSDLEHDIIFELMFGKGVEYEGKIGSMLLFARPDVCTGVAVHVENSFILHLRTYILDRYCLAKLGLDYLDDLVNLSETGVDVRIDSSKDYSTKIQISTSLVCSAFDHIKKIEQ